MDRATLSRRTVPILLAVVAGCGPAPAPAPTEITVTPTSLTFDPATCKMMTGTLGLGLGSATVEIVKRDKGVCTFNFTHEVEGGYKVYRVEVPTDSGPVEIHAEPDGAEVRTSFDPKKAKVIDRGNVHFD